MIDYKNTFQFISKKFKLKNTKRDTVIINIDRSDLAELFFELKFTSGAEIGVEIGKYSEILCKANPDLRLFCIDPWKVYRRYIDEDNQRVLDGNFKITKKRLAPYNCEIIRKSSTGALKDFTPQSLDFVYIDGNHQYEYVLEDLIGWSKVVKSGGIVSGHDYMSRLKKNRGVTEAVDEYINKQELKLFRIIKNGDSSWFFVND